LLAIISLASLALGLLVIPLSPSPVNIDALLFGDILSASWITVVISAMMSLAILSCLVLFRYPLLAICINEELAATEGIAVQRLKLMLFLLLTGLVAIAVQAVGVLLVSALLLMPAASARRFSATPTRMLVLAPVIGVVAVVGGMLMAWHFDLAAGPAMVVIAAAIWLLSFLKSPVA